MASQAPSRRVLVLEHLPFVQKLSPRGVLFMLFEDGDVCFVPVPEQVKTDGDALMLTADQGELARKLRNQPNVFHSSSAYSSSSSAPQDHNSGSGGGGGSSNGTGGYDHNKYFCYDSAVPFDREACVVHRFHFRPGFVPRRIRFSARKRYLLLCDAVVDEAALTATTNVAAAAGGGGAGSDANNASSSGRARNGAGRTLRTNDETRRWSPPCLFVFQIVTVTGNGDSSHEGDGDDGVTDGDKLSRHAATREKPSTAVDSRQKIPQEYTHPLHHKQVEHGARIELLLRELAQTCVDACFSPDDRFLSVVPSQAPSYIFMLELPKHLASTLSPHTQRHALVRSAALPGNRTAGIAFEARQTGQLRILGPAKGWFGQPHCASSICSAQAYAPDTSLSHLFARQREGDEARVSKIDFVTCTDSETGEFCVWRLLDRAFMSSDDSDGAMLFTVRPYLAVPCAAPNADWWQKTGAQQNFVLDAALPPPSQRFADAERYDSGKTLLTLLIRRTDSTGTSIGLLSIEVEADPDSAPAAVSVDEQRAKQPRNRRSTGSNASNGPSNNVKSTNDIGTTALRYVEIARQNMRVGSMSSDDVDEPDCRGVGMIRFMQPFLLGPDQRVASVCAFGKGMCEIVDGAYLSWFHNLYERFVKHCVLVCDVDEYQRFWIEELSDGTHNVRAVAILPREYSDHPEWPQLFEMTRVEQLTWRVLARRVGYFISEVEPQNNVLLQPSSSHSKARQPDSSPRAAFAATNLAHVQGMRWHTVEVYDGLHLYRCFSPACLRPLLKPLLCGFCKSAVYCSESCQHAHWDIGHADECQNHKA